MTRRVTATALLLVALLVAGCGDDDAPVTTQATGPQPAPTPTPSGLVTRVLDGDLDTPIAGATVAAFDSGHQLGPGTVTGADGTWTLPAGATLSWAKVEGRLPGYRYITAGQTQPVDVRLYDPALQNPEVGGGPARTRYVPGIVIPAPSGPATWRRRTTYPLGQPPVVSNGIAILVDTNGRMIAINTRTNTRRWVRRIGSSGRGAMTTPTILQADGRVLVSSTDRGLGSYDLGKGTLEASFATGPNPLSTPPLVLKDAVFVGSEAGRIYRLARRDLGQRCSFLAATAVVGTPALAPVGVVFADADGTVYAIDQANCRELWRYNSGAPIADGPTIAGNAVIVGNAAGRVVGIDQATGKPAWIHRAAGAVSGAAATDGELVYIGNRAGWMEALNVTTGERRWQTNVAQTISGSATIVGPNVYFSSGSPTDSSVYAARRQDGGIVWQSPTANRTAVVAAGKTLFVIEPKALRAYRAP